MSFLRFIVLFAILTIPISVFSEESGCLDIESLKSKYFESNQYNEFIEELNNYKSKDKNIRPCLDYYKALGRYKQLSYLEEKQLWDDYFANGNSYREQIVENSKKVISQVESGNPLKIKSMLLLWQFHRNQQDAFYEQALVDLMWELNVYSKNKSSSPELIKEVADKLLANEEKQNARLAYKLYVNKLVEGKLTDGEMEKTAAGFYKDGNLELAMSVYDIYIDRIAKTLPPEKLSAKLFEIASLFVYKPKGLFDMDYAEKIYSRLESLGIKDSFNKETLYLRAFNLEKLKNYEKAAKFYQELVNLFPDTSRHDEAVYKIAVINAYGLASPAEAKKYFESLTSQPELSPQGVKSLYHLGLIAQWAGDKETAKNNYDLVLKNAEGYPSIVAQAQERVKEIEENREISYNLKTFLDLSLKKDVTLLESSQLDLKSSSYVLEKAQNFTASSLVNMPQSGCNQVQLQYLWSGDLGGADPQLEESNFEGSYSDSGTKEINLVVVSPTGIVDRSFIMNDVY
ncbi:MAG: tetratricopeptide repeat protein [Candidatus Omnitrophica bacterium]|nr:tetratricopeptide repeat protein [Candidatus Omnitrophota bacterium]